MNKLSVCYKTDITPDEISVIPLLKTFLSFLFFIFSKTCYPMVAQPILLLITTIYEWERDLIVIANHAAMQP